MQPATVGARRSSAPQGSDRSAGRSAGGRNAAGQAGLWSPTWARPTHNGRRSGGAVGFRGVRHRVGQVLAAHASDGLVLNASAKFLGAVDAVTLSLTAVMVGGVWLGSHATERSPLALPTILLVVAAVLLVAGIGRPTQGGHRGNL